MIRASKRKTLPPIRPNAGTESLYRRKLTRLVAEMSNSVIHWISASYRANEPKMAQDALPAEELRRSVRRLARRWQKQFDEAAPLLAAYFAQAANKRTASQLQTILRNGGFTIQFTMSPEARDVMRASINEQVSLIKSIPQKYFTDVEGAVMRSVQNGHDLKTLVDQLGPKVDLARIRMGRKPGESDKSLAARTQRRAIFIAKDQTRKMTARLTRVRQTEIGIFEAEWVHTGGAHEPRPTHVAASKRKQRYDIRVGWLDPAVGKYIFPGELPGCGCVSRSIIPGF